MKYATGQFLFKKVEFVVLYDFFQIAYRLAIIVSYYEHSSME